MADDKTYYQMTAHIISVECLIQPNRVSATKAYPGLHLSKSFTPWQLVSSRINQNNPMTTKRFTRTT